MPGAYLSAARDTKLAKTTTFEKLNATISTLAHICLLVKATQLARDQTLHKSQTSDHFAMEDYGKDWPANQICVTQFHHTAPYIKYPRVMQYLCPNKG